MSAAFVGRQAGLGDPPCATSRTRPERRPWTCGKTSTKRTLALAETALGQIRALRQPALPRNFELWYQYAAGYNPDLNKSINATLAQHGTLSEADVENIYDTFFSADRASERIDTVGSRVLDEIKQVLDMLDAASGSATNYSESLVDASEKLAGGGDREALRVVIERLGTTPAPARVA